MNIGALLAPLAVGRALPVDPQWARKVRDGSYARIEPFDKNKAERVN